MLGGPQREVGRLWRVMGGLRGSWEGLKDLKAGRQVDGRASKVAGGCSGG